ncbi:Transcription intermediary factor 1-alpha [Mactra antiquata]
MASGDTQAMSEETYEYICTSCAEDDLIKEALKYCVDCQRYRCKDCLTFHRRIPSLREHTFLDNSAVKPQGQPRSLPAFPTKQCGKHTGKIIEMYCGDHDDVCCCVCAAEDHRLCKDILSVSNNIDRLYSKSDTARATFALTKLIDDMTAWQTNTDTLPRRLRDSKAFAIKAVSDFRNKMEKFLKKLEEASIKMIENEY